MSAPPAAGSKHLRRRGAVSAEPPPADDGTFTPKLIDKDSETLGRLRTSLEKCVLFKVMDENELQTIMGAMFEVKKNTGELVIKQGDEGDNFYVIEDGVFDIFVKRPGTTPSTPYGDKVLTVTKGQFFGELALMYSKPRAATVVAKTDARLWAIDRVHYRHLLMGATMNKRKQYGDALERVPILSSLDKYERLTIADAVTPFTFNKDDTIIRQGDPGDCFYIILEGEVTCVKGTPGNEVEVGHLVPNDYFGELALLNNSPRACTVRVVTEKCKGIKLDRERVRDDGGDGVIPVCEIIGSNRANIEEKY